jgi:hypothetical protein
MEKKTIHTADEYSVSPNSGRLRKRIRKKRKKFFSKRKIKRLVEYFLWIVILVVFAYALIVIIPEIGILSSKKTPGRERTR